MIRSRITQLFDRVLKPYRKNAFMVSAKEILSTRPVAMKPAPLLFLTQLQHQDVVAYLIAIKSIYRSFREGSALIVDDGSLTVEDRDILSEHVPLLDFIDVSDVDTSDFMKGGTWERLITILDRCRDSFVIQVDADLVGVKKDESLFNLYKGNTPFALSNLKRPGRVTLQEMSRWMENQGWPATSVQIVAEYHMKDLALSFDARYIRATSAFAGFPKGSDLLPKAVEFHQKMSVLIPEFWHRWGSEQVTSNLLVASSGEAVELAPPDYVNNMPHLSVKDARIVHFFGTYRFHGSRYKHAAAEVIGELAS